MNYFNPLSSPYSSALQNLLAAPNLASLAPLPALGMQWIAVRQRFQQFHANLLLTPKQFRQSKGSCGSCQTGVPRRNASCRR